MGSDLTVVNAARVSMNKHSKEFNEKDEKLIQYLSKNGHWTPFSHVQITIREKVPIFVARQRFKHMVGFTYNELSRRYVDDTPEFFTPDKWRKRAENVKQGSSDEEVIGNKEVLIMEHNFGTKQTKEYKEKRLVADIREIESFQDIEVSYQSLMALCNSYYKFLLDAGVAPEQARMVLPQSMYTEYYVTGSLAAWARAYKLRIDGHAQREIQDLAKKWDEIIRPLFPVSWSALVD